MSPGGDEAGAVVAAETEEIADEALRLLDVQWEELPFALRRPRRCAADAPLIHPEINPASNLFPVAETSAGRLLRARRRRGRLAAADVVVEVSSRHHRSDHGCLDTRGCLVRWDGDKLTCWTNLYQADQTRMYFAEMLDLPAQQGAGDLPLCGWLVWAGQRWHPDLLHLHVDPRPPHRPPRALQAHAPRGLSRHAQFGRVPPARRSHADGRMTALETHALGDSGGYAEHTHAAVKMVLELDALEVLLPRIPAVRLKGHSVYTNSIPGGCMRGIGNIQFNMAMGLAVDKLAERLGTDPIEVAVRNFSHEWEDVPNASLSAVLAAGAERIGWDRRAAPGRRLPGRTANAVASDSRSTTPGTPLGRRMRADVSRSASRSTRTAPWSWTRHRPRPARAPTRARCWPAPSPWRLSA